MVASPPSSEGSSTPGAMVWATSMSGSIPLRLDRPSRRREVERGGEMQRPITDGVCGLHGSLAKGARTDQGRGLISCKAPATISAADAVPSTTSGLPCDWSSPGRAGRGIFSKLARSALRQIRVASKQELREKSSTPSRMPTAIPSFTLGPTKSIRPPDISRSSEAMY